MDVGCRALELIPWGLGFKVFSVDLGCRVLSLGRGVYDLGFGVYGVVV